MDIGFLGDMRVLTTTSIIPIQEIDERSIIRQIDDRKRNIYMMFKCYTKNELIGIKLKGMDKPLICGRDTEIMVNRNFGNRGKKRIYIKAINILRRDRVVFADRVGWGERKIERTFYVDLEIPRVQLFNLVIPKNEHYIVEGFLTRNLFHRGDKTIMNIHKMAGADIDERHFEE